METAEMRSLLEKGNFFAINNHAAKASQRAAIDNSTDDDRSMRHRAADLGEKIRSEDGIANVIAIVNAIEKLRL